MRAAILAMKNCTASSRIVGGAERGEAARRRRGAARRPRRGARASARHDDLSRFHFFSLQIGCKIGRAPRRQTASDGSCVLARRLSALDRRGDRLRRAAGRAAARGAPLEPQGVALLHDAGRDRRRQRAALARRLRGLLRGGVLRAAPRVPPPRRHDEHARARRAARRRQHRRAARGAGLGGDGKRGRQGLRGVDGGGARRRAASSPPSRATTTAGRTPSRRRRPPATTSSRTTSTCGTAASRSR